MSDQNPHQDDGRKVFVVGPVERWILGVTSTLIVAGLIGFASMVRANNTEVIDKLEKMQQGTTRIELAQAISSNELNEVKAKQVAILIQTSKIPVLELRTDMNANDIAELKKARR